MCQSLIVALTIGICPLYITCSAMSPPNPSLLLTNASTSPFMSASNPSIEGSRGSGSCLGVGVLLVCGSKDPVVLAAVLAAEVPFVDAVGSGEEEAISSSRDVAASSLCTNY